MGVVGVAITIWITLQSNAENGKDTAAAISQMASIAKSMAKQQTALIRQADATAAAAQATTNSSIAIEQQTDAVKNNVNVARSSLKLANSGDAALVNEGLQDLGVGHRYKVNVTIVNTGRNPISNVFVKAAASFRKEADIPDIATVSYSTLPNAHILSIGGRNGVTLTGNDVVTQQVYDAFKREDFGLMVVGAAQFEDANGLHHRYSCTFYHADPLIATGCIVGNDD
ncbi:hypothetical protein [Sphingomonas sp. GC_Shp_3]|uniref:hypothetical protein n=1 Tax=Sphingomonas sp. GC_Shp_3 TaxID=2937383 RepID=UPI002269CEE1|nr:hypothetical protein [Sphingomonas sp. GC_Shp_3]